MKIQAAHGCFFCKCFLLDYTHNIFYTGIFIGASETGLERTLDRCKSRDCTHTFFVRNFRDTNYSRFSQFSNAIKESRDKLSDSVETSSPK